MDEYERRGNKSPAPKTSFQRELEARMRERKMKGLSADITPSDSAQGSDEELNSDDELLDGFNMTAKHGNNKWQRKSPVPNGRGSPAVGHSSNNSYSGRKSPYEPGGKSAVDELFGRKTPTKYTEDDGDEEPADLMMTMRKPWAPPGSRKTNDDRKPAAAPRKPWQPPAMRKANLEEDEEEEEEEDYRPTRQQQRPKSPSVRGRRTPVDLDAIEEDSEDRAPQPRARGARGSTADEPKPKPKPRRASSKYEEEEEEEFKKKARKSPTTDIFSSKPRPKTPTKDTEKKVQSRYMKGKSTEKEEGRKTPTGKKTPEPKKPSLLDEMSGGDASTNKKKTRGLLKDDTDSDDSCDREPGRRLGLGRRGKSPYDDGPDRYGRRTPEDRYSNDRKSPFRRDGEDEYDGRGPDRYDRKSPFRRVGEDEYDHQYPDRNNRMSAFDGPRLKKSQSRDDDENGYGQYERRGKENQPTHAQRKSRSQTKSPHDDRESSLCRDVEKDPGPMRKSDTQEGKEIKKRELKAQTSENQLLESAIRNVKDINDKTDQFKPVEPDGGNRQDSSSGDGKTPPPGSTKTWRHRPKPRYVKPVVETRPVAPATPTTDFNSTTSIKDTIYLEWYKEKQERAKKELAEKKRKEKEEEEKKKREEEEKLLEAKASFNGWMEKKKDYVQNKKDKEEKERAKKQKEEEEKQEKLKEAEMSYKSWKEEKDARLREQQRKKEKEEARKRREEEEKKQEKEKESKSAFNSWNEKKTERLKSAKKEEKEKAKAKEEEEQNEKQYTEEEAREAYIKWMERKEQQQRRQRERARRRRGMESPRPPFSPAGKHVVVS